MSGGVFRDTRWARVGEVRLIQQLSGLWDLNDITNQRTIGCQVGAPLSGLSEQDRYIC